MSQDLRDHLEKKEYDKITSAKELAQTLTEQLQAVSKDKHLRVIYTYSAAPPALMKEDGKPDFQKQKEMLAKMKAQGTAMNFGFEKVERLDGNIGYILLVLNLNSADSMGELGFMIYFLSFIMKQVIYLLPHAK